MGILFRNYFDHENKYVLNKRNNKIDFGSIFVGAIKKSIDTILLICGIVTVFMLLSSIIGNIFNFDSYNSSQSPAN